MFGLYWTYSIGRKMSRRNRRTDRINGHPKKKRKNLSIKAWLILNERLYKYIFFTPANNRIIEEFPRLPSKQKFVLFI